MQLKDGVLWSLKYLYDIKFDDGVYGYPESVNMELR